MQILLARKTLLVLCGVSGSGKSTFANRHFPPTHVVSSDACRAMICDDPYDQSISAQAFRLAHAIVALRLKMQRFTVFDATSVTPESRRALRNIARRHRFNTALIAFDTSAELCFARDVARPHPVGREVIQRQLEAFRKSLPQFPREGWTQWAVLSPDQAERCELQLQVEAFFRTC